MAREETIEIPFGAKDSELNGWEYTIPEGMEAIIENGKVIVCQKKRDDEMIRREIIQYIKASIRHWKGDIYYSSWVDYLERQKEQKPINPSDDELQRHQDELYDFKVFATKQAKEHHISFVHDFEWNNFCAELLSYFNEKHEPAERGEDERIRKELVNFIKKNSATPFALYDRFTPEQYIAYLEKQKDVDNYYINVIFPFKAMVKENGKIVTILTGQLSSDNKYWEKYQSSSEDGFKVYNPDEIINIEV